MLARDKHAAKSFIGLGPGVFTTQTDHHLGVIILVVGGFVKILTLPNVFDQK
jgi:hypothetical protein